MAYLPQGGYIACRKRIRTGKSDLSTAASVNYLGAGAVGYDIPDAERISAFWVNVSAIAGGSATVTVKLQMSWDGGVTWIDSGFATSALSATDSGVKVAITEDLAPKIRFVATLSNTTTPTATVEVWMGYNSPQGGLPKGAGGSAAL